MTYNNKNMAETQNEYAKNVVMTVTKCSSMSDTTALLIIFWKMLVKKNIKKY